MIETSFLIASRETEIKNERAVLGGSLRKRRNALGKGGGPLQVLVDYLNDRPGLPRGSVLVPGCGTGHDVRAWAKAGFNATGLDLAASAIRLSREKTEAMGLKAEFRQLNFLEVEPYEKFDYVFEHTLFCAIQPDQRDKYVEAVYRWLKSSGSVRCCFLHDP